MIAPRLVAPLIACGVAVCSAVVGGACVHPTPINSIKLETGEYVLSMVNGQSPPAVFSDSTRSLRIFTDTFTLNTTTQSFDEHTSAAITPRGGVEQPVALIQINHQQYALPSTSTVTFVLTIFGTSTSGSILSSTSFLLQLTDRTVWRYDKR